MCLLIFWIQYTISYNIQTRAWTLSSFADKWPLKRKNISYIERRNSITGLEFLWSFFDANLKFYTDFFWSINPYKSKIKITLKAILYNKFDFNNKF